MEPILILLVIAFVIRQSFLWWERSDKHREFLREEILKDSFINNAIEKNPELHRLYWNPKRSPVPRDLRPRVLARTGNRCFYCDINLLELTHWQIDHVWPYRYGGSEELINLVPSCKECNEAKWSYLPPRYLLHKWVIGQSFTPHELRFLAYYRETSMANLIGTSAHWKGRADYWQITIFRAFVELVTTNESIKNTTGKRREELSQKALSIFEKLDCDITSRRRSSNVIKDWLDSQEMWEKIQDERRL